MKANEIEDGKVLMIGDLVVGCIETDIVGEATYKILCKVTDINHYGDVRCEALEPFPDELDWQDGDDFSWIEPIPLTPEILEKNGFKTHIPENHLETVYACQDVSNAVADELYALWPYQDGSFYLLLRVNGKDMVRIDVHYIHQLQHALRLCGIDKNIEL